MKIVYLDPGHGGKDPGAIGNGYNEKDIVLRIALLTGELLSKHVEVRYTRKTDVFIELSDRAKAANKANADLFVSFHNNAAANTGARGVETYVYHGKDNTLAKNIQESVVNSGIFTANRGVKSADFAVVRETRMLSALVELGFITNKDDAHLLMTKTDSIAMAVANGILKTLGMQLLQEKKPETVVNKSGISDSAKEASLKAVKAGIMADGDGDGHIDNPKDPLTREQFVVVLDRLGLLDSK